MSAICHIARSCRAAALLVGLLAATAVNAQIIPSISLSDNNPAFLDGSTAARRYFNFAPLEAKIEAVTFSINFSKFAVLDDDPPFFDSFALVLSSIDSTLFTPLKSLLLIDFNSFNTGFWGDRFSGTLNFNDHAPSFVNSDPNALLTGTYRPVNPLDIFGGDPFANLWELQIVTGTTGAPLNYFGSTLNISYTPVPEASTFGFAGALLLVGLVFRKRLQPKSQA